MITHDPQNRTRQKNRVRQAMADNLPKAPKLSMLLTASLKAHEVSLSDFMLHKNDRRTVYVSIRQWYCWLATRYCYTTTEAGALIGRDHSTVVYASAKIEELMNTYASLKEFRTRIFQELRALLLTQINKHHHGNPVVYNAYHTLCGGSGRIPVRVQKRIKLPPNMGAIHRLRPKKILEAC